MFDNKAILITGGTGSFGRAFIRKLLTEYKPARVVVFSRDEYKQFEMQQEFEKLDKDQMRYFLGDVRDGQRLRQAMSGIDLVVHAAALKQVPAAEYNPMECIKTNINGAQNVIDAALDCNVEKVIALSTDKAASPVNLYGTSKLVSDKLFIAANNVSGSKRTIFSVVRYGNVAGSRGSVLPYFTNLISQGITCLPVTDERMTRFWITLAEGVEFVVKNFLRMQGGEIFVPKLPSIRITDLVKSLGTSLNYKIVGIRPGEKIHEIMCPKDDAHLTVEFTDHFVIMPTILFKDKINYFLNKLNEKAIPVDPDFEYQSGSNPVFLSLEQLKQLNKICMSNSYSRKTELEQV